MRIETELRRTFWPKRGNGGLEIGFGNFAEPDFFVSAEKVVHPLDMRRG